MPFWGSICRVCSSSGDYEIFAKIPTYLHATTNDFLNWQKPINILLEETTGLKVTPEDGLPRHMCAPCISYLKHAITFRDQCLSNAISLKAAATYQTAEQLNKLLVQGENKVDNEDLLVTKQDLRYVERPVHNSLLNNLNQRELDKVHKQLLNRSAPSQESYEQQILHLNLIFDKETNAGMLPLPNNSGHPDSSAGGSLNGEELTTPITSSEDFEDSTSKLDTNFYTYKEKIFEEDDIMDLEALRNAVTMRIPESSKERKCRACFRRFMFEETYTEHLNSCPEHYFLSLTDDINKLLHIRKNKAISPHQYIRRMIFCIRKTCDWLKSNSFDEFIFNSVQQQIKRIECITLKSIALDEKSKPITKSKQCNINENAPINEASCLKEALYKNYRKKSITSSPITLSNNILYKIERSESLNQTRKKKSEQK